MSDIRSINTGSNKKKSKGTFGIAIVAIIALAIVALIIYKTTDLQNDLSAKEQLLENYLAQTEQEKAKTGEIETEIKYRQTDDYIKDEAREIFGLHDPDEVIFHATDLEAGK